MHPFHYIEKTGWSPKEPFYVLKFKGEWFPCDYHEGAKRAEEEGRPIEVYTNDGCRKTKKYIKAPLYAGTYESTSLQEYVDEWGWDCLFYSITGKRLNYRDYAFQGMRREIYAFQNFGFEYVFNINNRVYKLNQMIRKEIIDRFNVDPEVEGYYKLPNGLWLNSEYFFKVKVRHTIALILGCAPNLDPIADDEKLWEHYASTEIFDARDASTIKLPIQMKARLTYLFNEQVSEEYEKILHDFPLDHPPLICA